MVYCLEGKSICEKKTGELEGKVKQKNMNKGEQ